MKKSSTRSNLLYNMTYQVLVLILPLITAPYISRVVGATGVGTYSYYNSIVTYFVYFAMLGVSNYGNRTIAACRGDKRLTDSKFSSIYTLQLITSLICIVIYIIYAVLIADNRSIALVFSLHVLSAAFDVSWLFFGLEEFKITSVRQIVIRILTLIFIFAFVKDSGDLWKYVLIMSAGYLLSAFSLWILAPRRVSWVRPTIKEVIKHLKPCLLLFFPIIATSVYRQMDKIMVGAISGMTEVGYYESAEKLIYISLGLISSFSAVIMPKISNLRSAGKMPEVKHLFDVSMEFAMCMGMAIGFGIASVSSEFIPIFFGAEYEPSISLSMALCITVPFISWACIVRTLYLIPFERDKIYVQSIVIGAVLNVIINASFIPSMGAMGAVIGSIVAEVSVAVYQSYKCRKEIRILRYFKSSLWFLLFGLIMMYIVRLVAQAVPTTILGLILEIFSGALVYCIFSFAYFWHTKNTVLLNALSSVKSYIAKKNNK